MTALFREFTTDTTVAAMSRADLAAFLFKCGSVPAEASQPRAQQILSKYGHRQFFGEEPAHLQLNEFLLLIPDAALHKSAPLLQELYHHKHRHDFALHNRRSTTTLLADLRTAFGRLLKSVFKPSVSAGPTATTLGKKASTAANAVTAVGLMNRSVEQSINGWM